MSLPVKALVGLAGIDIMIIYYVFYVLSILCVNCHFDELCRAILSKNFTYQSKMHATSFGDTSVVEGVSVTWLLGQG